MATHRPSEILRTELSRISEAYREVDAQRRALEAELAASLTAESGLVGCVIQWTEERYLWKKSATRTLKMIVERINYHGTAFGRSVVADGSIGTSRRELRVLGKDAQPFENLGKRNDG